MRICSVELRRYSQEIYESESAAADRNRFLGSLMQSRHAFPDVCEDHTESLELYFQCCSITSALRGSCEESGRV